MLLKYTDYCYKTLLLIILAACISSSPLRVQADAGKDLSPPANTSQDCDKLSDAIQQRNIEAVKGLLDKGVSTECNCGNYSDTPLMQAVSDRSTEIIKLLVSRGANVNPKGAFHGRTPLTLAAQRGCLDIVKFLIEHGADVNANCTEQGHSGYLASEGIGPRNPTPLGAAVAGGAAVVEYLLQHGAKVNSRDGSSYTPLMWACADGDLKVVQMLLLHGADTTLKTDLGQTTRSFAAARNYTDILTLLDATSRK